MNDDTDRCPGTNRNGEPCGHPTGWGTDFDDGPCKFHLGTSPDGSSHRNNGHAETHALTADPFKYRERQPESEQAWIFELTEALLDRLRRQKGDIDPADRVLVTRIAIKLHIAAKATEYIDSKGLVQRVRVEKNGAKYEKEIPNSLLDQLRKFDRECYNELRDLDLLPGGNDAGTTTEGVITIISSEVNHDDGGR